MKIIYLTTDDPLYLPAFFDKVLAQSTAYDSVVYVVPPLFRNQTTFDAVKRWYRTFGMNAVIGLAWHVLLAKLKRQSISSACKKHDVESSLIPDVNAPDFLAHLETLSPDLIVSVSCPQIFKKPLIDLPPKGLLNIHGAILPYYRGMIPSFWMLANGEKQAGVTIHFVDEKIDAGEICGQRIFDIDPNITLDQFIRHSKSIGADLLLETLSKIEHGTITSEPLNTKEGTYNSWPDAESVERFRIAGRRLW